MVRFFLGVRLARRGCPWGCDLPIVAGMAVTTWRGSHVHELPADGPL